MIRVLKDMVLSGTIGFVTAAIVVIPLHPKDYSIWDSIVYGLLAFVFSSIVSLVIDAYGFVTRRVQ